MPNDELLIVEETARELQEDAAEDARDAAPVRRTPAKPLDELEWEHLQAVLTDCRGNISEAARRLGMHRRSLQRKLARARKP